MMPQERQEQRVSELLLGTRKGTEGPEGFRTALLREFFHVKLSGDLPSHRTLLAYFRKRKEQASDQPQLVFEFSPLGKSSSGREPFASPQQYVGFHERVVSESQIEILRRHRD